MPRPSRTLTPLATVACTIVLAACPLPIARTEATSAPVVGTIVWADGTPESELDVAASTGWGESACNQVVARSRTTGSGAFELPGTEKHYSTTWVVPNLDLVAPSFHLCAGVGDTLRRAYRGRGPVSLP